MCLKGRGGFLELESSAKLGLLSSVLQWQAIIRQRAGTHARDNSVGGRGGRIKKRGTKMGA